MYMPAYLRCLLLNEYTKSVPMSLSSCVREDLLPRSILVWCKWHRGHGQQGKVLEQAGKRTSRKQEVRLAFSPPPPSPPPPPPLHSQTTLDNCPPGPTWFLERAAGRCSIGYEISTLPRAAAKTKARFPRKSAHCWLPPESGVAGLSHTCGWIFQSRNPEVSRLADTDTSLR